MKSLLQFLNNFFQHNAAGIEGYAYVIDTINRREQADAGNPERPSEHR